MVEKVSHISNEQEQDDLAALEILKERFGEEEWSLKKRLLGQLQIMSTKLGRTPQLRSQ